MQLPLTNHTSHTDITVFSGQTGSFLKYGLRKKKKNQNEPSTKVHSWGVRGKT